MPSIGALQAVAKLPEMPTPPSLVLKPPSARPSWGRRSV
jgi:hypothetical protein